MLVCATLSQASDSLSNLSFCHLPSQWFTCSVMSPEIMEMSVHVVGTEFPPAALGVGMTLTFVPRGRGDSHS